MKAFRFWDTRETQSPSSKSSRLNRCRTHAKLSPEPGPADSGCPFESQVGERRISITRFAYSALVLAFVTAAAAQTPISPQLPSGATAQPTETTAHPQILATIPPNSMTVTEWYKQNVYDPQDNKIGEIMDVLMDKDGKATALIIGVGGLLGAVRRTLPFPSMRSSSRRPRTTRSTL